MQKKQYQDDDGRVICSMSADSGKQKKQDFHHGRVAAYEVVPVERLTRSEARQYTWYALLAAMLIAMVFSITWILFGLFCTKIWFA